MMKENFERLEVKLGSIEETYLVVETDAPPAYDGFGTISVTGSNHKRWVLIQDRHFAWQVGRYASGMHSATPVESKHIAWVEEKLYYQLIR